MKETSFIDQNKEKWTRFEKLYASKSQDPEELSNLYMDLTDDLSYSQTFYKRRTVRVYLNQLAQMIYSGVHKQKKNSFKKLFTVWKVSLPLEIYRSRKNLLFALVAFLVYCFIGVITAQYDPEFSKIALSENYVRMTNENIKNGNPLGVYGNLTNFNNSQMAMFLYITLNNLSVAFLTFFVGFFFTILTHMLMFYNGVMLGVFQHFFYSKGLLITSFLGIWIHGAFEISAIVLAGGAGLTAGNGWLFPRSYTRLQSLQLSTKRGLKIMMSLVPFIIAAGFLESYVTHNYQALPDWSKWMLIMLSFGLILFVYVFYPMYIARKYPHLVDQEETAPFRSSKPIDFLRIRNAGEVLADSFQFYRIHFAKFGRIIFAIVLPLVVGLIFLQDLQHYSELKYQYWYDWVGQLGIMIGYDFHSIQDLLVCIGWTFIVAIIFTSVFWSMKTVEDKFSWRSYFQYARKRFLAVWLGNILLVSVVFITPWYLLIWLTALLPFFYLNSATMALDDASFGKRLRRSFVFSKNHYGKSLLLLLLLIVFVAIIAQPIAFVFSIQETYMREPLVKDLLDFLAELTKRVAREFTGDYMVVSNIVRQLFYLIFILGIIPLVAITTGISYFSELDKTEATGLKRNFTKFGKRDRYQEKPADFE